MATDEQRNRLKRLSGFAESSQVSHALTDANRDSPDDSRTGLDILDFPGSCKAKAQFGQLPSPRAARTVVEGLIWPFSLAFGRTPPSVALERMTTGRLTQALVVAVAVVPRSAAESPGIIPSTPRPRPSGI